MTLVASRYQQYKAPTEDQSALVAPTGDELVNSIVEHKPLFGSEDGTQPEVDFCGIGIAQFRQQARAEAVELARKYTSNYASVGKTPYADEPIVMGGHQPELFHSGVWFKNFLLSSLAKRSGAVAINFLVDNDLCRSTSIRVPKVEPGGSISQRQIPFDQPLSAVPWELRRLESQATWDAFPQQVKQLLPTLPTPMLDALWPLAQQALNDSQKPGPALAQARHQLEQTLGLKTLEVPLSHLVSTVSFARFSVQLLSELPRFQNVYNDQLKNYRSAHGIRNHAHPVPALEQDDGWLEGPWWVYRQNAPSRKRLWVRLMDDHLILCDRAGWQATIEGRLECKNTTSQWLDLAREGIYIRPRALLTTMFMRLGITDLFLHGIGGGKYDQLTDSIIENFFGLTPPPICVASATVRLPQLQNITDDAATIEAQIRQQKSKLWQLEHKPENFLAGSDEAQSLIERKRALLQSIPDRGEKWKWHHELKGVNSQLATLAHAFSQPQENRLAELVELQKQIQHSTSREYSFCLFPLEYLADELKRLATIGPSL